MGSYPALFIKLSSSLVKTVVLLWSFMSRLEDGLCAGAVHSQLGWAPREGLPAGWVKVWGSLLEQVGSFPWETGRTALRWLVTRLCSRVALQQLGMC